MNRSRRTLAVVTLLCVAALADIATTWYGIEHAGLYEANQNVAPLLETYGYLVLFPLKAVSVLFAIAAWNICASLWDDRSSWVVYSPALAVIVFNGAVAAHNASLIFAA